MTTIDVTIGWTQYPNERGGALTSMVDGKVHIPFWDAYVPGMPQHTETISLEVAFDYATIGAPPKVPLYVEWIAEAAFEALNSPTPAQSDNETAVQIYLAVLETGYRGEDAHYSLSVGDTVTVGEVMLACTRDGWQRVVGVSA